MGILKPAEPQGPIDACLFSLRCVVLETELYDAKFAKDGLELKPRIRTRRTGLYTARVMRNKNYADTQWAFPAAVLCTVCSSCKYSANSMTGDTCRP